MLQQEVVSEVLGDIHLPPQLPPLNNLPQWSRVNTLDRARYPKPFRKDRLQPLPSQLMEGLLDGANMADDADVVGASADGQTASFTSGENDLVDAARLQHLERNLQFLQQQHKDVLHNLHQEIDSLKRENQDLQFRIIMVQRGTPVPPQASPPELPSPAKSRSAKGGSRSQGSSAKAKKAAEGQKPSSGALPEAHTEEKLDEVKMIFLEEEIKDLKKVLREEKNKNAYLTQLIEQAQAKFLEQGMKEENPSEAMSAPPHVKPVGAHMDQPSVPAREALPYSACTDPLQVLDVSGIQRPPTLEECEVIIKHLLRLNDRQSHELTQLKSDLRDVLYSHKWSPDAYLLAKAYVVEDEAKESATRDRLPRLQLRQQSRKLPDVAYVQRDQVNLPALKQTLGNKAIERRKRAQILQKSRQRREVLH